MRFVVRTLKFVWAYPDHLTRFRRSRRVFRFTLFRHMVDHSLFLRKIQIQSLHLCVPFLDEVGFLFTSPFLELSFSGDGFVDILVDFVVNDVTTIVLAGKGVLLEFVLDVLVEATGEGLCEAYIVDRSAWVTEDVYVEGGVVHCIAPSR